MNLIPLIGTDEVTFGTHEQKIIELFGQPTPSGHYPDILFYGTQHYSVASSDRRLISITVVLSLSGEDTYPTEPVFLWGTDISEHSSYQLLDLLRLKQSGEKVVKEWHGLRDWDSTVLDGGILVKDFSNGDWTIEVPECGIKIECLGGEVECITICAVDD